MTKREFHITDASRGAAITVKVVPKANRTEVVGIEDDGTIKIRLLSPPVEGELNEELVSFLADFLGISRSSVEIVAGHEGRKKLISLLNIRSSEVERRVREAIGE
jgi:hypothetical protein